MANGQFKKGHNLATGRPKGSKNVKTQQWEGLGDYITRIGADKFLYELQILEGKEYIDMYTKILEYFKPKLARKEHVGKGGKDLFEPLTETQKIELAKLWAK